MGKDQLTELGVNDSIVHENFTIGTSDLEITDLTSGGERISVFYEG